MKVANELCIDIKITKLQMFMLKMINCPRVIFGLPAICPRWCISVSNPYVKTQK